MSLLVSAGCGSSGTNQAAQVAAARAEEARRVAVQAGLPGAVADFFALAASAAGHTFTVDYEVLGGGGSRVAQRPPDRMVDLTPPDGSETRIVVNAQGTFSCARRGANWSCSSGAQAPTIGVFTPDAMQAAIQALAASAPAYRFRVDARTIARVGARCLVASPKGNGKTQVLCIAPDGATLLTDGTAQPVTATAYRPTASDGDFRLPAQPS